MNPVKTATRVGAVFLTSGAALMIAQRSLAYFGESLLETDPDLQAVAPNLSSAGLAAVAVGLSALLTRYVLRKRLTKKLRSILEDNV